MQLPLGSVVKFFGSSLEVTRNTLTYDSEGLPVPGAGSTVTVIASVQPLSARRRKTLPEAYRDEAEVAIYSDTALLTGGSSGQLPDSFTWQGRTYEVIAAQDWAPAGQHFEAVAKLQDRP